MHYWYLVRGSFLEIYNEDIRDLLSKNPKDKHNAQNVDDIQTIPLGSITILGWRTTISFVTPAPLHYALRSEPAA